MSRPLEVAASAPGKLYLFGEYAVLAGSWSLVAAVDRRVYAERYADTRTYRAEGLPEDDEALVRAVLRVVDAELDPGRFATDVRAMYDSGTKLGLGSSAASTVALTGVAAASTEGAGDFPARPKVLELAERAHAAFQDGLGSGGALVAASIGGLLASRRLIPTAVFSKLVPDLELEEAQRTEHFEFEARSLPEDVEVRAFWLGSPASTSGFVRNVERKLRLAPAEVYRRLEQIGGVAERAIEACRGEEAEAFVEAVAEGDRAMEQLGSTCEVPIIVDAHRELRAAARGYDIAVKPSGAGGGDFSLAVGRSRADWGGFTAELPETVRAISLSFGADGLRPEPRDDGSE